MPYSNTTIIAIFLFVKIWLEDIKSKKQIILYKNKKHITNFGTSEKK